MVPRALRRRAGPLPRRVVEGDEPLATIAATAGFADQAHMTRDIRALTGRTPGEWRRVGMQLSFETAAG
ncbi:helix-turn-helix domain-containing protein [Nannocystis bainbridge]|uniref:Helix-turn-helix domain-containing protein n=1 Tax=Nannocystis bainbridge TaxID=2995303 RepID=A0ABT5DR81_9BACT|nr:helix-turn-helix domain-containing protein [Nannocystis bainbridge]MDC0716159.1 helix-turn-helix domain-containing protein [Nannocystis bainbridge]